MGCIDAKDWWSGKKSKWMLITLCNIRCLETKATRKAIKFYYSEGESLYCAGSALALQVQGSFCSEPCMCIDQKSITETTNESVTFKSADMWCVHAFWDTDMRIFKQHTRRPSTSWQMWRSWSPALQCDVFLGYTEGLVVFMRRDETGLEHRMDHSERQSGGRGGGRRRGDEGRGEIFAILSC